MATVCLIIPTMFLPGCSPLQYVPVNSRLEYGVISLSVVGREELDIYFTKGLVCTQMTINTKCWSQPTEFGMHAFILWPLIRYSAVQIVHGTRKVYFRSTHIWTANVPGGTFEIRSRDGYHPEADQLANINLLTYEIGSRTSPRNVLPATRIKTRSPIYGVA